MRDVVEILGYKLDLFGRRYLIGGAQRQTHRFDALAFMDRETARALGAGDWLPREACCELCRRSFTMGDNALTTCRRPDCMPRAMSLRGRAVHAYPPVRLT